MFDLYTHIISVLLNKWEKLLSKIKENIQHSEVYESLRTDVMSLRRDLVLVLEEIAMATSNPLALALTTAMASTSKARAT